MIYIYILITSLLNVYSVTGLYCNSFLICEENVNTVLHNSDESQTLRRRVECWFQTLTGIKN